MQVNKPKNRPNKSARAGADRVVEDPAKRARLKYAQNRPGNNRGREDAAAKSEPTPVISGEPKKPLTTEDAIIDLYEDPFKKDKGDEQVVINIDFAKPIEVLGKVLRRIVELARVAQSKITKENANKLIAHVKTATLKQKLIYAGVTTFALVFFVGGTILEQGGNSGSGDNGGQVQGDQSQSVELAIAPEFEILYPAARTKEDFAAGIAKISPPGAPATYAYVDNVNGSELQVSQQQLPDRFKSNQDQEFKEFAESFAANTKVDGDNLLAYVGLNAEGPQSVVMIKDDLLILIKTKKELPPEVWSQYLTSFTKK
jgi:hypothetical protein